ncbi:MAG: OmpH family outer membrane protein [Candidatus Omnitrophica bacterium]|nr:OmpH family outer membrane protein [Candidatus Omnitrophota bacterium]
MKKMHGILKDIRRFELVLFFLMSSIFVCSKELKIGVVNIERIYANYEKAKSVRDEIQSKRREKQEELSKKQVELKKLKEEYDRKKEKLKGEEKEKYEKKINDLIAEINTFVNLTNQQLIDENRKKTQELLNDIAKVIQDYASKNAYDLIIDKKSLPYFNPSFDISEEIIKILNQNK